ncbi:MAG: RNA polymerase-binding protein DksA [Rubrivivax sp.]|nr:RNA polymerase-binding protein DksA [Rubrivivax sp.]
MSKPPAKAAAKAAAVSKAPAKTAKAPSPSVAPKSAPVKGAAVKNAPAQASPKKPEPAAKAAPKKAASAKPSAAAPVTPQVKVPLKTPAPAPAPKAGAGSKATPAAAAPQAPPTAPAPIANRFTDRFAPAAKPAARPMTETAELPKPVQKIDPKLANAWKSKPGRELSEAELLAMPESEYMNDKQLDFFRARLQQQKDDLLSSAGETTEHLREDTSIVPDPVDRATIEEEHALELRTRDRERKLLKKIAQSLARLETGEYGYCDETGEPIGLQRLMARPTASLSLEAQQRRELKQKMFGD